MKKIYFTIVFCLVALMAQSQMVAPYSYIEANNVRMRAMGDGSIFSVAFDYNSCKPQEVPVGSGKATIFQQALWLGGYDASDNLHLAAMTHGQFGIDYWSGPLRLADASTDMKTQLKYHHVWNLTRDEIEDFIAHHGDVNYEIPDDILTWPAHGEEGFAENLAPFVDVNGDNHYNPNDGDYPDIKGDHCLFYIFNDNAGAHTESGGEPLGIEVHGMVYAFSDYKNDTLNNTVFFNYKFFNRSANDYHDCYLAVWDDMDIGYVSDDYVGCDVQRSSFFTYNGDDFDEDGDEQLGYGYDWPVQVGTILAGPYMDADGRDNPAFNGDCAMLQDPEHPLDQYAYNGYGFGNGVADDERYGMCYCIYHNNPYFGLQTTPEDYYRMICLMGYDFRFFYPGDSDPCMWGTGFEVPQYSFYYTEEEEGNEPSDRRVVGSCGPFHLNAGQMQELDFAQITVFSDEEQTQMERKGDFIDYIRQFFANQNAK